MDCTYRHLLIVNGLQNSGRRSTLQAVTDIVASVAELRQILSFDIGGAWLQWRAYDRA